MLYRNLSHPKGNVEWLRVKKDPLIVRFKRLAQKLSSKYGVKILSIVLYGSRAYGHARTRSDYDFFILLADEVSLLQFTQFSGELRLLANKLDKLNRIKIYVNTLTAFKRILRENPLLGAFCYVISTMGIPIYDPKKTFKKLKKEMEGLSLEEERAFLEKCLKASRKLGSEKWVKYWKERLKSLKAK